MDGLSKYFIQKLAEERKKRGYVMSHVGKGKDRVAVKMSGSPLNRKQPAFLPSQSTIFQDSVLYGQQARSI